MDKDDRVASGIGTKYANVQLQLLFFSSGKT